VGQRVGARLTIAVIGILSVLASVVTAAAPLIATSALMFTTLVIARSLLGVAHGGLFPVEAGTIRHWYPVGRWSSMVGLLVTGLWTGAAIASPLVASLMEAYGWQAAILLTSVPSLVLVVLWWIVVRDQPGQHPWIRPEELAETAANPHYDATAPLTLRRVARVLGDPQILLVTLSYLVMNYVFYLVTFWSFLYLVQDRKLSVLESGRRADRGRPAPPPRRQARPAHPPARHAAARRAFPVPHRFDRQCVSRDRGALPRVRLRGAERGQLLGRRHATRAQRFHGGDRGAQHRRQHRRRDRNRARRVAVRAGPLGHGVHDRRRHVDRRRAPVAHD
jgi:hypothetical protein